MKILQQLKITAILVTIMAFMSLLVGDGFTENDHIDRALSRLENAQRNLFGDESLDIESTLNEENREHTRSNVDQREAVEGFDKDKGREDVSAELQKKQSADSEEEFEITDKYTIKVGHEVNDPFAYEIGKGKRQVFINGQLVSEVFDGKLVVYYDPYNILEGVGFTTQDERDEYRNKLVDYLAGTLNEGETFKFYIALFNQYGKANVVSSIVEKSKGLRNVIGRDDVDRYNFQKIYDEKATQGGRQLTPFQSILGDKGRLEDVAGYKNRRLQAGDGKEQLLDEDGMAFSNNTEDDANAAPGNKNPEEEKTVLEEIQLLYGLKEELQYKEALTEGEKEKVIEIAREAMEDAAAAKRAEDFIRIAERVMESLIAIFKDAKLIQEAYGALINNWLLLYAEYIDNTRAVYQVMADKFGIDDEEIAKLELPKAYKNMPNMTRDVRRKIVMDMTLREIQAKKEKGEALTDSETGLLDYCNSASVQEELKKYEKTYNEKLANALSGFISSIREAVFGTEEAASTTNDKGAFHALFHLGSEKE